MAHRKPLYTTCRIYFRRDEWDDPPKLGDSFQSDVGTLYRILGIEEGRNRTSYLVERVVLDDLDGDTYVYPFYWLSRNRVRTV